MQIYKITNLITGKIYIGKDESSRHQYFGSGKLIKRSLDKYGRENHTKEILEEVYDRKTLQEREKFWIKKFNSYNLNIGYNISLGGDGGDTLSNNSNRDKIVAKISQTLKGRRFTDEHLKNLKQKHPKLKMSEKNMDKESWLRNIRQAHSKRKGKTLEQIVGENKAKEVKDVLKQRRKEREHLFNTRVGKYSLDGTLLREYNSQQEAAQKEGIRQGDISNCIKGRQKTVKGYIWKLI
jgi:group I intron endonuclease